MHICFVLGSPELDPKTPGVTGTLRSGAEHSRPPPGATKVNYGSKASQEPASSNNSIHTLSGNNTLTYVYMVEKGFPPHLRGQNSGFTWSFICVLTILETIT